MLEWSTSGNLNNSNSPGISGELIPYIESISPATIPGTGTTEITITGENFIPNNNLSIPASVLTISGASSVVYSIISPTRILVIITTNNATGNLSVTIANGNRVSSIWGEKFIVIAADLYSQNVCLLMKGDGDNSSVNIIDSSPSPKAISRFGSIVLTTAQKKYGSASIKIDANGQYLSIPYSADFNWFATDYTIESWLFLTTQNTTFPHLIGLMDPNGGTNYWSFGVSSSGILTFYYWNGGAQNLSGGNVALNQWHHVAMSHKKNTGIYLFLNGVKSGPFPVSNPIFASMPIIIGSVNGISIKGFIDSLRLTKGVARYIDSFNPETATSLNV